MSKKKPSHNRPTRVATTVQSELATILRQEVHEADLAMVSLTRVWLAKDLRLARVYYLPLGGGDVDLARIQEFLTGKSKWLRGRLSDRLQLRFTPRLEFYLDDQLEEAVRITNLLNNLNISNEDEIE
jgi:ribosome-binding factor A